MSNLIRYGLERFFGADMRSEHDTTCPLCDCPLLKGERVMTDPGATDEPAETRFAHRSCVLTAPAALGEFRRLRRHRLQHPSKPAEAPAEQLGLFSAHGVQREGRHGS